jgi:hypothetical protein
MKRLLIRFCYWLAGKLAANAGPIQTRTPVYKFKSVNYGRTFEVGRFGRGLAAAFGQVGKLT